MVTCARIADQKDPAAFAAICRAVRKRRPDIAFRWIGDGDERQRRMLECAGVQVTGWKSHKDAVHAIAKGCIYLSTSRWEGMSISILEAMFLGVPVVLPAAEWNAEIIRDGETGRLFDSVQSAVDMLLSADQSWRQTVSQQAWRVAKERYSRQRFAKDLMKIYREVIGEEALHPSADGRQASRQP